MLAGFWCTHPMGEVIERKKTAFAQASEDFVVVQTMGGRMHVRWNHEAQATPHGQIVYFAEFLATTGIFDNWVKAVRCTTPAPAPQACATCWASRSVTAPRRS